MNALKIIISGLGNVIKMVIGSRAGRELQKGNGGLMRTFNKLNRRIKK